MLIRKHEFPGNISIVNLGDVHRGDERCDVKTFHRHIKYIADHDNMYWLSTSDLLNVALKTSKSSVYKSLSPQVELDLLAKEIEPIAHKCLGFVSSNHHNRVGNEVGLSLDESIAVKTGIPFLGAVGLLNIKVGATCYYLAMHHGVGGGSRRGGKANKLEDLSTLIPGADVYLEGHTHANISFTNETNYIDRKRNTLKEMKQHFATTGHYLLWDGSYAQELKLRPMPIGASLIELAASSQGRDCDKKVRIYFLD